MVLKNKKILLGVCGSIAAYKALFLTRLLKKQEAEVQILMTQSATAFVSTLSFSTLSKRTVYTSVMDEHSWNNHVDLGLWADLMLIAPLTANTMAKLSIGLADNIISACYLSARCPVFLAPAMDLDMWKHPATQDNVKRLKTFGNHFIDPGYGELASGLIGHGRLAEPQDILTRLESHFLNSKKLEGKKVLINAGPTRETIDPVRFISNHSSGKMGIALARQALLRGAEVTLILGPSSQEIPSGLKKLVRIQSAQEMYNETTAAFEHSDIAILTAAVADYKPEHISKEKIKKSGDTLKLQLVKTKDIAQDLGRKKRANQILVGFALESQNEEKNAFEKLKKKNFDLIVLNSLKDKGAAFQTDTNKISIIDRNNNLEVFELKSKDNVASDILDAIQKINTTG